MLKKVSYAITLCLIALAVFGCQGVNDLSSRDSVTFTKSSELFHYVQANYNGDFQADGLLGTFISASRTDEDQPISICEATLVDNKGKKKQVYVVALSGTEFVLGQSTGVITDLLSGFCLNSPYLKNVCKAIKTAVPSGANLVITGHSLGGMIAQQVAADSDIKRNYNVLNTVTYGSPLLAAGSREGTTKRLGDTSDVVPYLSGSLFNNTIWAIAGLNRETGGYGLNFLDAHNISYGRNDVWGAYDVLGEKDGKAKLVIYIDSIKYFANPFIESPFTF